MDLKTFEKKALNQFTRDITDIFFQYIEEDRKLLQDYISTIGRESDLDTANKKLGKAVKVYFNLENGKINKNPKSKLIRSFTEHKKKVQNE